MNPQGLRHMPLKHACLPIPPSPLRIFSENSTPEGESIYFVRVIIRREQNVVESRGGKKQFLQKPKEQTITLSRATSKRAVFFLAWPSQEKNCASPEAIQAFSWERPSCNEPFFLLRSPIRISSNLPLERFDLFKHFNIKLIGRPTCTLLHRYQLFY